MKYLLILLAFITSSNAIEKDSSWALVIAVPKASYNFIRPQTSTTIPTIISRYYGIELGHNMKNLDYKTNNSVRTSEQFGILIMEDSNRDGTQMLAYEHKYSYISPIVFVGSFVVEAGFGVYTGETNQNTSLGLGTLLAGSFVLAPMINLEIILGVEQRYIGHYYFDTGFAKNASSGSEMIDSNIYTFSLRYKFTTNKRR